MKTTGASESVTSQHPTSTAERGMRQEVSVNRSGQEIKDLLESLNNHILADPRIFKSMLSC